MNITVSQLSQATLCTFSEADRWLGHINTAMTRWGIDNPRRIAAFLAQISYESGRLRRLEESLNYSVQGLANTWPSRFAVQGTSPREPNELAKRLGRTPTQACKQEALANFVYDRAELGNTAFGDGWKYRGRGLKQLTGKFNYAAYQKATGLPVVDNPDMVLRMEHAADSAGWYWASHGCNALADIGNYRGVTLAINGGLLGHEDGNQTGLDDRVELYVNAKGIFGVA